MTSLKNGLRFALRVLKRFSDNKGLLLAGSVAYNTLLSIVPLFAILLVSLSHFFDTPRILQVIRYELSVIAPSHAEQLAQDIAKILEKRELVEGVSVVVLLFLSSLSFRILEDAMAIIFSGKLPETDHTPAFTRVLKRQFWLSTVIPMGYVIGLGAVLFAGTLLTAFLDSIAGEGSQLFGIHVSGNIWGTGIWFLSLSLQILLLASLYKVLPTIQIKTSRALVGGLVAGLLWESIRHGLSWYFHKISLVGRVYGSLTAVIVILLMLEVAAVIVLLGAQVIAELRACEIAGCPWHSDPYLHASPRPVEVSADTTTAI